MDKLRRRTISAFEGKPTIATTASSPFALTEDDLDTEMQKISIFKRKVYFFSLSFLNSNRR